MKIYLVVAVWGNTRKNHAGMYYLAKCLKSHFGDKIIIIPTPTKGSRFLFPFYRLWNVLIGLWLRIVASRKDVVFLMEYLLPETEQSDIAKLLRNRCRVRGIAHLVPQRIEREYDDEDIRERISYLEKIYVLGSSLKDFFVQKDIETTKLAITFHYVDTDYYYYLPVLNSNERLIAICMGNMERDYDKLLQIIRSCDNVCFRICKGKSVFPIEFESLPNVEMYGFMEEAELRDLMQTSDLSLSVMKDTIGSNVITTSLACGLAVVASNVGSIRDYVTDKKEGFLFGDIEECVSILNGLDRQRDMLERVKLAARERSKRISLECFFEWFKKEFYNE